MWRPVKNAASRQGCTTKPGRAAHSGRTWQKGDPRPFCSQRCRTRRWQKDNPERVAATQQRAKATALARGTQLRNTLYTQQDGQCAVCDERFTLSDRLSWPIGSPVSHPQCSDGDIHGLPIVSCSTAGATCPRKWHVPAVRTPASSGDPCRDKETPPDGRTDAPQRCDY